MMHGDCWTGRLVLDGLIDAFRGLAIWSPAKDDLQPIGPDTDRIEGPGLITSTAIVLGRKSLARERILTYASRVAQQRAAGFSKLAVDDYCQATGWPKSSFWAALGDVAKYLNARARERMGLAS